MRRQSGEHDRPREARLRAASAHLYPGVTPEIWIQASTMADIVWSQRLRQGAGVAGPAGARRRTFRVPPRGVAPG